MKIKQWVHGCLDYFVQTTFRLFTRDSLYSGYLTQASYSPWKKDKTFLDLFQRVKAFTLVDKYKAYSLYMLVQQVSKLKGALIEIGVWRGGSGLLIAKRAEMCGIEDNIYLCDTFSGVVKAGESDPDFVGGEYADTSSEAVKALINDFNIRNTFVLEGIFPDETASMVRDKQIRFCHIDVDTYQSAKDILDWVWPRLCNGGILVYDDFGFPKTRGIRKHVEEQLNMPDRIVIHNLTGQGIVIKIA